MPQLKSDGDDDDTMANGRAILARALEIDDCADLIGWLPSSSLLDVQSATCETQQQQQEAMLTRVAQLPRLGRWFRRLVFNLTRSLADPVEEHQKATLITTKPHLSSVVCLFSGNATVQVRKSILILGPPGLQKSMVVKHLWCMAPDKFFSPSRKTIVFL